MARFAENTTVSVEKSRCEIESILDRYGAESFVYATGPLGAMIQFDAKGRRVKFILPLPDRNDKVFGHKGIRNKPTSVEERYALWEQACRSRWRSLALAIKAKLETVECGISEFEQEFLAHIINPATGRTVGEEVLPLIAENYDDPESSRALALPYFGGN